MPENIGNKIQSALKSIYDVADLKYVQPLKRQVFKADSKNASPRMSPIKSPPPPSPPRRSSRDAAGSFHRAKTSAAAAAAAAATSTTETGKVRFEDFAELPLRLKLDEKEQRLRKGSTTATSSPFNDGEVNEFKLRELVRERDALREQVSTLANFNYAREPEFARDHMKLRELTQDVQRRIRHLNSRHLKPVMSKCAGIEEQFTKLAREFEEKSELMASEFLGEGAAGNGGMLTETEVRKFLDDYVDVRKQASRKRILADRMAKERNTLENLIPCFLGKWDERAREGMHHRDDDDDQTLHSSPSPSSGFNDLKNGTPERQRRQHQRGS